MDQSTPKSCQAIDKEQVSVDKVNESFCPTRQSYLGAATSTIGILDPRE